MTTKVNLKTLRRMQQRETQSNREKACDGSGPPGSRHQNRLGRQEHVWWPWDRAKKEDRGTSPGPQPRTGEAGPWGHGSRGGRWGGHTPHGLSEEGHPSQGSTQTPWGERASHFTQWEIQMRTGAEQRAKFSKQLVNRPELTIRDDRRVFQLLA